MRSFLVITNFLCIGLPVLPVPISLSIVTLGSKGGSKFRWARLADRRGRPQAFVKVATRDSRNDFRIVTDGNLAKAYNVSKMPAIVFFRKFDEPRVRLKIYMSLSLRPSSAVIDKINGPLFHNELAPLLLLLTWQPKTLSCAWQVDYQGAMKVADIEEAVQFSSIRTVIPFIEENSEEIFRNDLPKVMMFGADRGEGAEDEFHKLAVEFKGKFIFATVGGGSDPQLWKFIGASDDGDEPEVFVFVPEKGGKYKMGDSFNAKAGKAFLDSFLKGEAMPFVKSQEIKEDWDKESVKEVVGKQFGDMIKEGSRPHYVLMVYAPWCGHCKEFIPKYDKAAAYFESKFGDEVTFVRMDGTENELQNFVISGFPTVFVFPKHMDKMDGPKDVSSHTSNLQVFASEVRKTCGLTLAKREGEREYEESARRFKAAVKAVKGSLADVASILNEAAERVEQMARPASAASA